MKGSKKIMKNKTKRLVSLLLMFMMVLTSVSLTAFAEDTSAEETAVTIEKNAVDFLPGGHNVGYYDASGTTAEISGSSICLRANEWARYAVVADVPGTYKVTLTYTTGGGEEWYTLTNETTGENKTGIVGGSAGWDVTTTNSQWNESGNGTMVDITFALKKGVNIIKVLKTSNPSYLYKMVFTKVGDYTVTVNHSEYTSLDGVEGATTGEIAYDMPIVRPERNHLGFTFGNLSGKYKVKLYAGGNTGSLPTFILTNKTTGEKIEKSTTTSMEFYQIDAYEMGEITLSKGDKFEISVSENAACFEKLELSYIGAPVYAVDCYDIINQTHNDGFYDNGGNGQLEAGCPFGKWFVVLRTNEWIKNSITVPVTGTYSVIFSRGHVGDERFTIENTTTDSSVTTLAEGTGDYATYADFTMGTLQMQAGENIIKTTNLSNACYADALKFVLVSEDKAATGEFSASDIETTTADVSDGSISMGASEYVVFDTVFENADYEVYINVTAAPVDSLIRVSSLLGTSEAYKFVKSGTVEEIKVPVKFSSTDEMLKIDVVYGEITFNSVATDKAAADYAAIMEAFDAAENAESVKAVFDDYDYDLWIDADSDIEGIFYPDSVFNTLLSNAYENAQELASAYNKAVYKERTAPSIVLKDSEGTATAEIKSGVMTMDVNADWIAEGTNVILAVYGGNKLVAVDMQEASADGITLEITVPASENATYTYKLMFWENGTLKPFNVKTKENVVYVSSLNGDDTNNGTEFAPVASFSRAKELANEKKNSTNGNVYVILNAGEYTVNSELVFSSADSGIETSYVVYKGDPNGGTVITGGEKLENWTEENGFYTSSFSKSGGLRQLEINGDAAVMSKSGEITATSLYSDSDETALYDGIIVNTADLHEDILNERTAEVVWNYQWRQYRFPVVAIEAYSDTETVLKLSKEFKYFESKASDGAIDYSYYDTIIDQPFVIENTLCYADEAGEFCYSGEKVYYCPKEGETVGGTVGYAPVSEGLMSFSGTEASKVKNIIVENITFKNGTWERPTENGLYIRQGDKYDTAAYQPYERQGDLIRGQITLDWCDNVIFRNNVVKNVGSAGVVFNEGVTNCKIENNEIFNTSAGAVRIGHHMHTGGQDSIRCKNNSVYNNKIYDTGLQYTSSPAISVYYTQNTSISHNDIKNCPYSGISVGWGWGEYVSGANGHTIEYNRIENVMTKMQDGAHIYTLGPIEGTVIRGNYLIKSCDDGGNGYGRADRGGIYFDNGSAGILAYNNVIKECSDWMFAHDPTLGTADPGNDDLNIINLPIYVYNNYSDTANYVDNAAQVFTEAAESLNSENAQRIIQNAGIE